VLLITNERPLRCPEWLDYTPNEVWADLGDKGALYRRSVQSWEKAWEISSVHKWVEVRVTNQASQLLAVRSSRWWDNPMWMDKLFWVYSKPLTIRPKPEQVYSFYVLEFFECLRVRDAAIARFGYNPFDTPAPGLLIPVECCELGWDDTQAGYATNIRQGAMERAKAPVPAEVQDKEAVAQEKVKSLTKELYDASEDTRWDVEGFNDY